MRFVVRLLQRAPNLIPKAPGAETGARHIVGQVTEGGCLAIQPLTG